MRYVYSPQSYSASYFGASMIAIILPSPVSNLTNTNKVDTDVKTDYDSQSFATPRKHNHISNSLCGKTTKTTQVHIKFHTRLCQHSP